MLQSQFNVGPFAGSLLNRRLQDIAMIMYKVKYGLAPSIVDELFKQKSTSYSLRNSDFDIPTFNTINS